MLENLKTRILTGVVGERKQMNRLLTGLKKVDG